jgi:TonB-dependent starch-binding outer membrane protein SusC
MNFFGIPKIISSFYLITTTMKNNYFKQRTQFPLMKTILIQRYLAVIFLCALFVHTVNGQGLGERENSGQVQTISMANKSDKAPPSVSEGKTTVTDVVQMMAHIITGTVTDAKNEPLIGASVVLEGTTKGAVTDENGNFKLELTDEEKKGKLVITFVGYEKETIPIDGRTVINVLLKESGVLNEVVVVGYGRQKKVNLVGAVATVNFDEKLAGRAVPNVSSGLSGLAPGLSAIQNSGMAGRNGATLLIRGLGTVNNSSPLIVVDGMPDVDINRININDVETVSVLKDATSASVYGSRAANGVVLITTKSGKGMKKTSLNFSSNMAMTLPTKAFDFLANYPVALTLEQRRASTNTLASNLIYKNGTVDQWMALGMIDPLRYPNTDWWDIIQRQGALENYNLSATGGTEKSNFFVSVGTKKEAGLQINNDYNQYNARFNFDYKVRDNMNTGVRFNGNWSKFLYALEEGYTDPAPTNTAGFDMQYAIAGILPFDPVSGNYGGVMAYGEDPQAYNPYTLYQNNLTRLERKEANTSMYLDWSPLKGLKATVEYGLNYYDMFGWNANTPNQAFNFQTNAYGSRVYVGPNAGVSNNTFNGYKTLLNGRLNYDVNFGKNHEVSALAVYSEEYWYDRFQGSSRNDRLFPGLHEIDAALTDIQTTGGNSSTEGLRSYIGRVNYTAFGKYLFEGNFRVDGSSRFVEGQRYGFFPSAALGWRFTEEKFLAPLTKFLSAGKLRLSYGTLGNNSGVGRYEQQTTLANSNYVVGGSVVKGFVNNKLVNQFLTWEETAVANLGLELGFFDNRLTAEFDYYDRLTTGMNRPSDLSILLTGAYSAPRTNIGNMRNRGIETTISWRSTIRSINYGTTLNASYNATRLEKWSEFLARGATTSGNNIALNLPYGFVYAYQDLGIAQTWADVYKATPQGAQPGDILRKDLNGDGRIDGNDQKVYPTTQQGRPTTYFSLNSYIGWKGIELSALFLGSTGRKDYWINAFNNVNFSTTRYAVTQSHLDNPWTVENREGLWPRLGGSGNNQTNTAFWLDDMTYLRLKNVQLSYSIPQDLFKRLGVSSLRIAGSAENLWTMTSYRGLDPEKEGNNNNLYPINKSYALSIQVGF